MPYDAFGNKVDDPPAGIASGGRGRPGVPGGEPPRRGPVILAAIIALAVLGGAVAGAAVLLAGGGEDDDVPAAATAVTAVAPVPETPRDPERKPDTPAAASPATPEPEEPAATVPAEAPRGLQRGSLLRRANFTVALRRLRAQAKGRPRNVRVEAERIDMQVVLRDGRLRSAQARWDGEIRVISTTSTPIGALPTFSWSAIDRGAPQRIVRSATGRARKPASAFNYAVLLDAAGLRWSAFLKTGEGFLATSSGRVERQISGR